MVGVAKEHESTRLLGAAYFMAFHAGMVNGITWLNPDSASLTSHMSGTATKGAIWFLDGKIQNSGGPAIALLVSFFGGSLTSGMITGYPR